MPITQACDMLQHVCQTEPWAARSSVRLSPVGNEHVGVIGIKKSLKGSSLLKKDQRKPTTNLNVADTSSYTKRHGVTGQQKAKMPTGSPTPACDNGCSPGNRKNFQDTRLATGCPNPNTRASTPHAGQEDPSNAIEKHRKHHKPDPFDITAGQR